MKQGFIPDSATITRREDGAWDMVALFRMDGLKGVYLRQRVVERGCGED